MSQIFNEKTIYELADDWVNDPSLSAAEVSQRFAELSNVLARIARQLSQCNLTMAGQKQMCAIRDHAQMESNAKAYLQLIRAGILPAGVTLLKAHTNKKTLGRLECHSQHAQTFLS